jgi:hypothetical protein
MYQWKARINIIGSKQVQGIHQSQMYSPIVAWPTTRFFSIQSLIHGWYTKQLDFVMAFPQAKVERERVVHGNTERNTAGRYKEQQGLCTTTTT